MITESIGPTLAVAIKNNNTIQSLNLAFNTLDKQDLRKIKEFCKRNIQNSEKIGLPDIRDELVDLMQTDEGIQVTEEQILERVKYLKMERISIEKEFIKEQDKFDLLKCKQENFYNRLLKMKAEVNEEMECIEIAEEKIIEKETEIMKDLQDKEEDIKFKIEMAKAQQKKINGKIQNALDQIDIKNREIQEVLFNKRKDLERVQKKKLFKKLKYEKNNMLNEIEQLKKDIENLEKRKKGKSLSTLRRTKTSYYKSCSIKQGSP